MMSDSENITLSLLQSRLLYKFNYGHIEPIAMQQGLITREFPANSWVVEALKVGYTVSQNASRHPTSQQPEKLKSLDSKQRDRVFLSRVLIQTIKVIGFERFLDLIWVLLKNFPYVITAINNVFICVERGSTGCGSFGRDFGDAPGS
ncbi:MAG: hypothetical protein HC810_04140 [Acaryochloridaceae cyanobacterium RL_2_7]|nr:hypothetical protein [Acaryochloridaceae cyanobacterium RL_2_7]